MGKAVAQATATAMALSSNLEIDKRERICARIDPCSGVRVQFRGDPSSHDDVVRSVMIVR